MKTRISRAPFPPSPRATGGTPVAPAAASPAVGLVHHRQHKGDEIQRLGDVRPPSDVVDTRVGYREMSDHETRVPSCRNPERGPAGVAVAGATVSSRRVLQGKQPALGQGEVLGLREPARPSGSNIRGGGPIQRCAAARDKEGLSALARLTQQARRLQVLQEANVGSFASGTSVLTGSFRITTPTSFISEG